MRTKSFVNKLNQITNALLSIDRSNHMVNPILSADTAAEIAVNFTHNIVEDSVLYSNGSWSYVAIAKGKKCEHKRLVNGKVRVIDKVYHI